VSVESIKASCIWITSRRSPAVTADEAPVAAPRLIDVEPLATEAAPG
jgi:hypothetical protein